jgi:hypothetical protein
MEQHIHRAERGWVNRKIKKSAGDPKGIRLHLFCPFAKARPRTGTWQCLWCPLPTPAAPLIYHRPGPLTKPTLLMCCCLLAVEVKGQRGTAQLPARRPGGDRIKRGGRREGAGESCSTNLSGKNSASDASEMCDMAHSLVEREKHSRSIDECSPAGQRSSCQSALQRLAEDR